MKMRLLLALASCACTHAARADALEDLVGLQVGSFSSEAQAKQDASYDAITWHVAELVGCDTVVTRAGTGRFEGTTVGNRCRNSYKGAAYAISQSVLTGDEMMNWDRGFNAAGELVWGPAAGGYRFRRIGGTESDASPVSQLPE